MKKTILGFAALSLLAALATSCNNDVVEAKGDAEKVITYGIATGKQTLGTRAKEESTLSLQKDGRQLTVETYDEDGEPFETFTLEYNSISPNSAFDGYWTYNSNVPVLHPNFDLYHYSVDPMAADFDNNAGEVSFTYDASTDADLIVASYGPTQPTDASSAKASLTYKHLLSQINFAVKGLENVKINVNNIQVNKVFGTGKFTFPSTWVNTGNPDNNYSYMTLGTEVTDGSTDVLYLTSDAMDPSGAVSLTRNNNNALMMVPQEFTSGLSTITFYYILSNMDDSAITNGTATINLSQGPAWVAGFRYLYIINFGAFITYEVEIDEEWQDGADTELKW